MRYGPFFESLNGATILSLTLLTVPCISLGFYRKHVLYHMATYYTPSDREQTGDLKGGRGCLGGEGSALAAGGKGMCYAAGVSDRARGYVVVVGGVEEVVGTAEARRSWNELKRAVGLN